VVAGLLASGAANRVAVGRPFYWASGLILGLALFSAISSFWSGSMELSVTEADRVLAYLGIFLAAFLIAQTDQRRQRFAEGIGIGLFIVVILVLGARLLPHVMPVAQTLGSGSRARYPLEYWNANGLCAALGAAMLLWMSRNSATSWLRPVALAGIAPALLALYFTYSRGGLLSLAVAAGLLLILSTDRLWLLATLAAGAIGAVPALLYVQGHEAVAKNLDVSGAVNQGLVTLLLLVAGMALSLALYVGLRRLEDAEHGMTTRAVAMSRNPRTLRLVALAIALVLIVGAIAVGGRAWHQFTSSDIQGPETGQSRIASFNGGGRSQFWEVALEAFGEKPVAGQGAGSYIFSWEKLRPVVFSVRQAHSLYLQSFADLGVIGGVTVLAMVLLLLWTGFAAWREAPRERRDLYAILLAAALTFAVGAAIDWFWEIAVLGTVFFLASGALVAARCGQLRRRAAAVPEGRSRTRLGLSIGGLVLAWVAALALVGPLLVNHEIKSSQSAAAAGNIGVAIERADTARSVEPWAASPYIQLSLLAELQKDYSTAISRMSEAIDREDRNWILYYLMARLQTEGGSQTAARENIEHARRLNPLEPCLKTAEGCG
jgi:hypothetical protein